LASSTCQSVSRAAAPAVDSLCCSSSFDPRLFGIFARLHLSDEDSRAKRRGQLRCSRFAESLNGPSVQNSSYRRHPRALCSARFVKHAPYDRPAVRHFIKAIVNTTRAWTLRKPFLGRARQKRETNHFNPPKVLGTPPPVFTSRPHSDWILARAPLCRHARLAGVICASCIITALAFHPLPRDIRL
jgi:hypothetical protein